MLLLFLSLAWAAFAADAALLNTTAIEADDYELLNQQLWYPRIGQAFQIVLSWTVEGDRARGPLMPEPVQIFDVDLFDNSVDDISRLREAGKRVICYFSAGTSETWRPDFAEFKPKDQAAALPMWPGEHWLDIRSPDVMRIMKARIRYAAWKGCDAIDPDNMDGYSNENGGGFTPPLTQKDSIKFTRELAQYARGWGMTMGLKNAQEIIPFVVREIAFAVNEQCGEDDAAGCDDYKQLLLAKRGRKMPVYHIEYITNPHVNNGTFGGNGTLATNGTGKWEFSADWDKTGNMTTEEIRSKLCLDNAPEIQEQMSTVIKVLKLDGWVMYCSGHVWQTRGSPIKTNPINAPGAQKPKGGHPADGNSTSSAAGGAASGVLPGETGSASEASPTGSSAGDSSASTAVATTASSLAGSESAAASTTAASSPSTSATSTSASASPSAGARSADSPAKLPASAQRDTAFAHYRLILAEPDPYDAKQDAKLQRQVDELVRNHKFSTARNGAAKDRRPSAYWLRYQYDDQKKKRDVRTTKRKNRGLNAWKLGYHI